MKRSLLAGLGLTLLGSMHLAGCAADEESECLPGDIDCGPGTLGKADGERSPLLREQPAVPAA
jgi:hypothetical protein